jgi:hypothetical protein
MLTSGGHCALLNRRKGRACSRSPQDASSAPAVLRQESCQRRRRPELPRASKGVTLLRIIRFSE